MQSDKNGRKISSFLKTLGMTGLADIAEARENLLASISDPNKKEEIAAEVEAQREHFDNVRDLPRQENPHTLITG